MAWVRTRLSARGFLDASSQRGGFMCLKLGMGKSNPDSIPDSIPTGIDRDRFSLESIGIDKTRVRFFRFQRESTRIRQNKFALAPPTPRCIYCCMSERCIHVLARDGQTPVQEPEPEQDFLHSGRIRIGFGFQNLCETGLISEFYRNFRSKDSSQISLVCKFSRMVRINEFLSTQFCVWR